ncbi:DinB family protein [Microvirga sp. ACRRW]|uniref:DinB family protein n=1 Tax=Microvirga sp. ACRRW TaxID=2918205 RepID=UPI001EF5A6CC|nr:DinB family protein [Microvirga sp. ACRRW]MCG7392131.1 DinB family protein [Microvirga sp. ACRRW]
MKSHFAMMAAYNAWCNERIYGVAAQLSEANFKADRGAFFKSVSGTLNHLLAADRIWLKRFTGEGDAPNRLDAILFATLPELERARRMEDARIVDYIEGLSEADIAGRLRYRTITNPVDIDQPLASTLVHFFNHQTHHRGQVHGLLTGFGLDAPVLDLIAFQRQTGIGMS